MASPDKQEQNGRQEQGEGRKDARVTFYGMVHSPFNLEGIKPAVNHFEQLLASSSGRNVLYREDATLTFEDAERNKIVIAHHGLVDPILGNIFRAHGELPRGQDDLDNLRQAVDRAGTRRAIESGLVPSHMAQDFFLSYELEKLRDRFPFDIEYESHSEDTVREISDLLTEAQALEGENLDYWMRGQVDRIVVNKKKSHRATFHIAQLRRPDIVDDLAKIAGDLAKDKQNGVTFVLFTVLNAPIIDSLQEDVPWETQIGFETINAGLPQSPDTKIQEGLRTGKEVPDEVYAQHFFQTLMSVSVQTAAMYRRRPSAYAENYETLARTISTIATSFSLQQIEEISKSRRDILDVLRTHPSSSPLLPYIIRLIL